MTLASVRLIARNNRFDCVMPVEHIGAWVQAMAECGALALYLYPNDPGYRLEFSIIELPT